MANDYDVIVIGAGHNGLITATILSMHGLRVAVLDKNPRPGGLAGGWPGGSVFAYAIGLIPSELDEWLGLTEGIVHKPDPSWVELDEDQRPIIRWWRNLRLLARELMENGIEGINEFYSLIERFWGCMKQRGLYYTGTPPSQGEAASVLDGCGVAEIVEKKSRTLINVYLGGREDLFLYPSMLDSNGFALAYYHQNMNRWNLPIGGMSRFAWRLYNRTRKAGAKVLLGKRVTGIQVERGKASGVLLEDGRRIHSRTIVYAGSIPYLRYLIDLPEYESSTLEKLSSKKYYVFRTDIILDKKPNPPIEDSWHGYPILVYWTKSGGGEYSYPTLISGTIEGLHLVQVGGSKVRPDDPVAPGVEPRHVVWYESRGPFHQEECCLNLTGHPDHIPMKDPIMFDQRPLPGWGAYRTSIPCLYHGSASSYPGGELNGVPGLNVALRILSDLGVKPRIPFLTKAAYRRTEGYPPRKQWGMTC